MSKPIKVKEAKFTMPEFEDKEYTYEDIFELFGEYAEDNLVVALAKRCIEYEKEIENLKIKIQDLYGVFYNCYG